MSMYWTYTSQYEARGRDLVNTIMSL